MTEQTALQKWNGIISDQIPTLLTFKPFSGLNAIQNRYFKKFFKEKSDAIVYAMQQFEVTKHRIIVDAMIARLQQMEGIIKGLRVDLDKLRFYQIKRKREVRQKLVGAENMLTAYKESVLILVNTYPPETPVK